MAKILSIQYYLSECLQRAQHWDRLLLVWVPTTRLCWRVVIDHSPLLEGRRRMYILELHSVQQDACWGSQRSRDQGKSRLTALLNAHHQMCSLSEMAGALAAPLKSLSLWVASFLSSSSLCGEVSSLFIFLSLILMLSLSFCGNKAFLYSLSF